MFRTTRRLRRHSNPYGLPSRLDILEAAGLRCAVISGRQGTRKLRHVVYVTGDQRDAPPQRSVEEILGLTASASTDFTGSDDHLPYAEVIEDAPANPHDGDEEYLAVDVETCTADRLLDVRTELLAELWNRFLHEGNASVLAGLQAAELLEHQAHLLASRPVRRRRDGDDRWTPELDDEIVGQYVSGRLIAEIAWAVDRPTTLTSERLAELGYPGSLWPAWDADAESALQTMISRSTPLAEIARSLKRSPWDITTLLTRRSAQ